MALKNDQAVRGNLTSMRAKRTIYCIPLIMPHRKNSEPLSRIPVAAFTITVLSSILLSESKELILIKASDSFL